ncbi:MAG: AbrB/MazE/SpoVT family DNA-binding domain-containing protein [Candidatus Delongbacteria bacterium]|nr:AbrB/MazE/SpoVT family DNA-binding domain-containing protein [Candidatus Delongbacteria bacterium]
MAQIVQIGNSKGIRIPKAVIEQAQLQGRELSFRIVKEGLLISPDKLPRQNWLEQILSIQSSYDQEQLDNEWLDVPLVSEEELEW